MSPGRIRLAAAACFVSAFLGAALLPSVALLPGQGVANLIALLSMALYVFILLTLRGALDERLGCRLPTWLVAGLLAGHLGLATASVVDDLVSFLIPLSVTLAWASSIVLAIALIALGTVVLRLRGALGLPGVSLAVLLIVEGLLFGTMVFMANAVLVAVVTDLLTGWILLRLALGHEALRVDIQPLHA